MFRQKKIIIFLKTLFIKKSSTLVEINFNLYETAVWMSNSDRTDPVSLIHFLFAKSAYYTVCWFKSLRILVLPTWISKDQQTFINQMMSHSHSVLKCAVIM